MWPTSRTIPKRLGCNSAHYDMMLKLTEDIKCVLLWRTSGSRACKQMDAQLPKELVAVKGKHPDRWQDKKRCRMTASHEKRGKMPPHLPPLQTMAC